VLNADRAEGLELDHPAVLDGCRCRRYPNEGREAEWQLCLVAMTRACETFNLVRPQSDS